MLTKKAAIIDMGTNTFHLVLVELFENHFKTIYKEKIPVKIGQGGISRNTIQEDGWKRAFHTLKHFKNLIDGESISEVFAFATSGVRNADNGKALVSGIKDEFGIEVQVIDGIQEAQMIYEGIRLSGALDERVALMMDIGGGSVEFIIGNSQEAFWKQSFEIGGQRMLDLFHYHDPILKEEVNNLAYYLDEKLNPLAQAIREYTPSVLVGASGTFDTLTDIYFESLLQCKLTGHHIFQLPVKDYRIIHQQLQEKTREERLMIPGMIPMRVDMIVVASCLIDYILQLVPVDEIACSAYALKEGAIATLMGKHSLASLSIK